MRRSLHLALGVAISAVAVWFSMRGVSVPEVWKALTRANHHLRLLTSLARHDIANRVTVLLARVELARNDLSGPELSAELDRIEVAHAARLKYAVRAIHPAQVVICTIGAQIEPAGDAETATLTGMLALTVSNAPVELAAGAHGPETTQR